MDNMEDLFTKILKRSDATSIRTGGKRSKMIGGNPRGESSLEDNYELDPETGVWTSKEANKFGARTSFGENMEDKALKEANLVDDFLEEYIDCSGMGILEVEDKLKAFADRGSEAEMTVQTNDGRCWHSTFNVDSWKKFKDAINGVDDFARNSGNWGKGASITKVWIKEKPIKKVSESIVDDFFTGKK